MVDLAQLVRVPDCGSVGRGFESHIPPFARETDLFVGPVSFFSEKLLALQRKYKDMKINKALLAISLAFLLSACTPTPVEKHFNVKLLFGEWVEGNVHDHYADDGTGYSWDDTETTEEEALPFEWSLRYDTLQVNHLLWEGGIVPKVYIVTALDSVRLDHYDLFSGEPHHYTKVTVP